MKKYYLIILFLIVGFGVSAQKQYTNPILAGFYPDPSICRVGTDYYLINSTFAYYPGLPVFHIAYAIDRPEQLPLQGAGVSRGLFAPAINYHKGLFYIVCTLIDKGGNFVITAKNPAGPWSNPVWLKEVDGIDPSLFFDKDDKAYIIYNSNPPGNKSLWDGHRTIRMREFDYSKLKVVGEEKLVINGGVDISKKPVWIEGPHIYKINDWYYLLCAEGGTAYNHSEVVFRSKSVGGPYVPYEKNPILTQRHLDPSRKDPITTTGHADLVQTQDGKWYAVFLGCRPYEGNFFNTGRETFMAPVKWVNDWPVILDGNEVVKYKYPLPLSSVYKNPVNLYSGNFTFKDDFNKPSLEKRYSFLRTVTKPWYSLKKKAGFLTMDVRSETAAGISNPSLVAHRQQHLTCEASTSLSFTPTNENEKAGVIIFQNEQHFYFLCKSLDKGKPVIQLYKSATSGADSTNMELLQTQSLTGNISKPVTLKIKADKSLSSFLYSIDGKNWILLQDNVDGKFLSTEKAGGFVGSVFGLYATSLGNHSNAKAAFDWFKYVGNDTMYK
jgi:xylan 1,4-beta-xylosidase